MLDQKHIRRRFERAADSFDDADFVHAVTREGLLSRLEPLLINAKTVVDLGAATGTTSRPLGKRFKGARVVSVDIAAAMLKKGRNKKAWLAKTAFAQASADRLPFADQSVDVIFSNMLLPWIDDPTPVFTEIARVLRKDGLFAFATLGPDSLQEINRAWAAVDGAAHVNRFLDMHDLGDGLVNAGLRDPVLDVDRLAVNYSGCDSLFRDLTSVGGRNALRQRMPGLTGRQRFERMKATLDGSATDGRITLELELVFGHCWGGGPKMDPSNYRIDAKQIPIRRN
jgi:malonyl-CoA O-methyltransferase